MSRALLILDSPGQRQKAACAVAGCTGNAHHSAKGARGFCARHYYRLMKHGDPNLGRIRPGEPVRFLREVVFPHSGDECLIWPYARNSAGYGHLLFNGRHQLAHRLACEAVSGEAPNITSQAAHSCGRGHEGCCNPRHIRWASPSDNLADKTAHGTASVGERHYAAKLTKADVLEIRSSDEPRPVLAKRFGVDPSNITAVRNFKSWKDVR